MDMAQPYTLGAAAYANIAIGRSRCPAASKALHGLSTWRASRSTAQSHPFRALIQMGQGSAFGIKATAFVDTGSNLPIRPAYPRSCRRSEEHTSELQSLMRISYA